MDAFKTALLQAGLKLENVDLDKFFGLLDRYERHTQRVSDAIYSRLNEADRARFVQWFLQRWGGISIVSAQELKSYDTAVKKFGSVPKTPTKVGKGDYVKVNFADQGPDFDLVQYDWVLGIHDIYYDQYEHGAVKISPKDTVIDAGAFIGDTAVLFSHKVAGECEVHSFELLDENLALISENLRINASVTKNVHVNKVALSDVHGEKLWIETNAIQGATKATDNKKSGREAIPTTTLDHYVKSRKLKSVDFIKMDIEGAEIPALKGAEETIRAYQPKLAVCLYHIWTDPFLIPELINSFGVSYEFGFKWVQLTKGWEAVLLANPVPEGSQGRQPLNLSEAEAMEVSEAFLAHAGKAYQKKFKQADAVWKKLQAAS